MKTTSAAIWLTIGLALASCASDATPAQRLQRLSSACDSYSGFLESAAVMKRNGELSEGQISAVNGVVQTVSPICEADQPPPNVEAALQMVRSAILQLQFAEQE